MIPPSFRFSPAHAVLAAGVVVHLLMLLSLRFGFLDPLFDDAVHRKGRGADLYAVVQAGQNISDGVSIYTTSPVQQVVPYYYPYRYHPFVAYTLGQFFLLLSPGAAYGLWIILLELLLMTNLFVTWRLFGGDRRAVIAMGMWLLFSPYYLELFMGQFSFVMASLMFWSFVAWERARQMTGDSFWSLSLVIKSNSAVLAPVLLKQGRWKAVAAAGFVAVLLAIPYFAAVPGTHEEFARNYTERMSVSTLFGNQGFAGLIGIALVRGSELWSDDLHLLHANKDRLDALMETPLLFWTFLVVGATLLVTVKARRDQAQLLFLLWILSYFLFYKHIWEHHYVMLLPVFVLLYGRPVAMRARRVLWTVFGITAMPTLFVLFDTGPVLVDPEISWEAWKSYTFHLPKPLAVLALYIALTFDILRTQS